MRFDGRETTFRAPAEALAAGVNMVFQENSLVPSMSVAQNVFLGDEKFFNRIRGVYIAAQQLMGELNFPVDPWATVATLGAAKKQMVEIARAVRKKARVIIFDEPTASLTPEEKLHFFALMRRLKARGVSIIFISHALEEALEAADRITVLRDGEVVATDAAQAFDRDQHHARDGRAQPLRRTLQAPRRGAEAGPARAERQEPVDGQYGPQQFVHRSTPGRSPACSG